MPKTAITPACPKCKNTRTKRVRREGLLQRFLFNRLGYFPWKCSHCGTRYLSKSRGGERQSRRRIASGTLTANTFE